MRFVGVMITTTALLSCIAADGSVPGPASDPTASVPVLARELDPQTLSDLFYDALVALRNEMTMEDD